MQADFKNTVMGIQPHFYSSEAGGVCQPIGCVSKRQHLSHDRIRISSVTLHRIRWVYNRAYKVSCVLTALTDIIGLLSAYSCTRFYAMPLISLVLVHSYFL